MANCAYLSQLSKIAGEVDLQIFLNKIIVWFDAVTLKKHPVIEMIQSPSVSSTLLLIFESYLNLNPVSSVLENLSDHAKPEFAVRLITSRSPASNRTFPFGIII